MAKEKSPTFEESVAQLEQIVAAIESGQIGLEESLRLTINSFLEENKDADI